MTKMTRIQVHIGKSPTRLLKCLPGRLFAKCAKVAKAAEKDGYFLAFLVLLAALAKTEWHQFLFPRFSWTSYNVFSYLRSSAFIGG